MLQILEDLGRRVRQRSLLLATHPVAIAIAIETVRVGTDDAHGCDAERADIGGVEGGWRRWHARSGRSYQAMGRYQGLRARTKRNEIKEHLPRRPRVALAGPELRSFASLARCVAVVIGGSCTASLDEPHPTTMRALANTRSQALLPELEALPACGTFDGELIAFNNNGQPDFVALTDRGRPPAVRLVGGYDAYVCNEQRRGGASAKPASQMPNVLNAVCARFMRE